MRGVWIPDEPHLVRSLLMGRKLSAGIACSFGSEGVPHGYAVRSTPDQGKHMCETCADAYDHLVDAQNAWQAAITTNVRDNHRRLASLESVQA